MEKNEKSNRPDVSVIPTGGCYDCGGRCLLKVHVKDGVAIRVETDDGEEPQLRACARGRAYRRTVYDPDRLKYPMKRAGARGQGNFLRISWDEALDTVARELNRVKTSYGPAAIFLVNIQGASGALHGAAPVRRLLSMFGGFVRLWGSPSAGAADFAQEIIYGDPGISNPSDDLVNARLILLWGENAAVSIQSTNTSYCLARAKEAGAKIICIDPRYTETAGVFADQWIPIRPGTDSAMLIAMAYVLITDNLEDRRFLEKYTLGFDRFKDYVTGKEDGVPKTPLWAEPITGVSALTIEKLAREYASAKPAALRTGRGPGRTAYGEQFHSAAMTLAAMTGNVGLSGGNAGGIGRGGVMNYKLMKRLPEPVNPVEAEFVRGLKSHDDPSVQIDPSIQNRSRVNFAKVWDAVLKGKNGGYPTDAKLFYVVAHNGLNQMPHTTKGVKALEKPEFIVVHEQFMTPTAKFADILLPANTFWERNDIFRPWGSGAYLIHGNQVIESLYESKSDFQICRELAIRLGINDYDAGKTEAEWLAELLNRTTDLPGNFPDYDAFKRAGVFKLKDHVPMVRFKEQIEDLEHHPFPTPSGKIEIYSKRLADLNNPRLPPFPRYIETWESVNDPLSKKYPLQLLTFHFRTRAHSCFDNNPWLKELEAQAVWIHSGDARERGINDGDSVRVFNDRGVMVLPALVTERIMPGVVAMGEGAWYRPDSLGHDRGGCANVLTKDEYSPSGGPSYNTSLVEVQKA